MNNNILKDSLGRILLRGDTVEFVYKGKIEVGYISVISPEPKITIGEFSKDTLIPFSSVAESGIYKLSRI